MLYFAYDASDNGNAVWHYALRLAGRAVPARIALLYVNDDAVPLAQVEARIERLRADAENGGVRLDVRVLPRRGSVADTLAAAIPHGRGSHVLCGLRAQQRDHTFLRGTVSHALLAARCFNVLAIRVVSPGLLGAPQEVLLPVSGHPEGVVQRLPMLEWMVPDWRRVHVLSVMLVSRFRERGLNYREMSALRSQGSAYLGRIEAELGPLLARGAHLDSATVVSHEPGVEIALFANKSRSELILMGATERSAPTRWMHGNVIEQVLGMAPCDVGVYRGVP